MQPFSRETIVDRRQPALRWSAVFGGAAVAAGSWLLLQLIFTGGALVAIDPEDADSVRTFGIGSTAGTLLAALVAMFLGGLVAGRLAGHYDRKVAGFHGILVWALTSILGVALLANAVSSLAMQHDTMAMSSVPPPGARAVLDQALRPVNERLETQDRPKVSVDRMIDASHHAVLPNGGFDREVFVQRLDDKTELTRAEADSVLRQFGDRADEVLAAGDALGQHRQEAMEVANETGKGLLAAGVALLLCLGATIAGALIAARSLTTRRRPNRPATEPGHTTAPYPPVTPSGTYQAATPPAPYPPGVTPPPADTD
jgi:hypothetical protein